MTKWLAVWLVLLTLVLGLPIAPTATAAAPAINFCRQLDNHSICIVSIQRSAKNYWEYKAAVRIDGIERPIELYNCRDRVRVQSNGAIVPFAPNGVDKLVCRLFK